uniref:Uncharacterized protein n=1 Tax=Ditylenchus dipsaci TaxID=166011 RepID=A0A915CM37_9BILA
MLKEVSATHQQPLNHPFIWLFVTADIEDCKGGLFAEELAASKAARPASTNSAKTKLGGALRSCCKSMAYYEEIDEKCN